MRPSLRDVHTMLADRSAMWDDIGRWLDVSYNKRQGWRLDASLSNEARLEAVINEWLVSESVPVTWEELINALDLNEMKDKAKQIRASLEKKEN